jgi:hypothetical protein
LLSELRFASHFAYSPRGVSEAAVRSREVRDLLKQNRRVAPALTAAELLARRVREAVGHFSGYFDPAAVVVPAPRSSRLLPGGPPRHFKRRILKYLKSVISYCMPPPSQTPAIRGNRDA